MWVLTGRACTTTGHRCAARGHTPHHVESKPGLLCVIDDAVIVTCFSTFFLCVKLRIKELIEIDCKRQLTVGFEGKTINTRPRPSERQRIRREKVLFPEGQYYSTSTMGHHNKQASRSSGDTKQCYVPAGLAKIIFLTESPLPPTVFSRAFEPGDIHYLTFFSMSHGTFLHGHPMACPRDAHEMPMRCPSDIPWASRGISWAAMGTPWVSREHPMGMPSASRGHPVGIRGHPKGSPWGAHVHAVVHHGHPMGIPSASHGHPMGILQHITGISWASHGHPAGIPWAFHVHPMGNPWVSRSISISWAS